MKEIINPTKRQIEKYLKIISWSLRHHGYGHYYFYNYKHKFTPLCLFCDRLQIDAKNFDESPSIVFYLKDVKMALLDDDCVSFGGKDNESIFLQCANYSKKDSL